MGTGPLWAPRIRIVLLSFLKLPLNNSKRNLKGRSRSCSSQQCACQIDVALDLLALSIAFSLCGENSPFYVLNNLDKPSSVLIFIGIKHPNEFAKGTH